MLRTLNVFNPISKELRNSYDIVNVRLVLTVVSDNDSEPLLENLMKMLSESRVESFSTLHPATLGGRDNDYPSWWNRVDIFSGQSIISKTPQSTLSSQVWTRRTFNSFLTVEETLYHSGRNPLSVRIKFTHLSFSATISWPPRLADIYSKQGPKAYPTIAIT